MKNDTKNVILALDDTPVSLGVVKVILGLGNYLAKLITETLGGAIRLDSATPERTRICFTLPKEALRT